MSHDNNIVQFRPQFW